MIQAWLAPSLKRIFPLERPGRADSLALLAARGERVSFQLGLRLTTGLRPVDIEIAASSRADLGVSVRRVGLVPVPRHNADTPSEELDGVGHIPGYVPDPLLPETTQALPPGINSAFWIDIDVPRDARPGPKKIAVEVRAPGQSRKPVARLDASVEIASLQVDKREGLHVTHWFYTDSLCDWYGVEPYEEAFWPICEAYMHDYAAHGLDTIYVPALTPSLDGEKRPTQLLGIKPKKGGGYRFDWREVKRYVDLAKRCGITHFEWPHLFTQWGARHAILVYEKRNGQDVPLWPNTTGATSDTYRAFLGPYLDSLRRFLDREGLRDKSFFHLSDEPHREHLDQYRRNREMLRELAPWMPVMDALSDIEFAREGVTDMPVPTISRALAFKREGIPSWAYFCCSPRGPYVNRLLDSPLPKARLVAWLLYRHGFLGFLHWGYNYWYKSQTRRMIDPYAANDGLAWPGWAHGDPFVVYPGEKGPIDSMRWEVFARGLQDYAMLQAAEVDPEARALASLRDFNDFPRDPQWIAKARRRILGCD